MDQPQPNTTNGTPPPMPPSMPAAEPKSGMGPLIGSIIVIVILVIGAIYFWGSKLNQDEAGVQSGAAATSTDDDPYVLDQELQSTTDVKADVNSF